MIAGRGKKLAPGFFALVDLLKYYPEHQKGGKSKNA